MHDKTHGKLERPISKAAQVETVLDRGSDSPFDCRSHRWNRRRYLDQSTWWSLSKHESATGHPNIAKATTGQFFGAIASTLMKRAHARRFIMRSGVTGVMTSALLGFRRFA